MMKRKASTTKKTYHLRDHLRMDLTSQSFNWKLGVFEAESKVPLSVQLILHAVLCIVLITIPTILYGLGVISGPYHLLSDRPPSERVWQLELLRWLLLLGFAYGGYVFMNVAAVLPAYITFQVYKRREGEVPTSLRSSIDQLLKIRIYLSRFAAAFSAFFFAKAFFPMTPEEQQLSMFGATASQAAQSNSTDDTPSKTANLIKGVTFASQLQHFGKSHSLHFFVDRIVLSVMIALGVIVVEKIIIQRISASFFKRSYSERIDDNEYALKVTRNLKKSFQQSNPELVGLDTATVIFDRVRLPHKKAIAMDDFYGHLPTADAQRYFGLIDLEITEEMSLEQLTRSINALYEENEILARGLSDQAQIIMKLDGLLLFFCWMLIIILILGVFQVSLQGFIAAMGGIFALVLLVSTGTMKTAFESIIFVIFTHPFDVGDQIIIRGEILTVKEVGLWTSTFSGPGNRLTYIANSRLRTEMIINTRRSPFQKETLTVHVLPSTSSESFKNLDKLLAGFLKRNSKDFLPKATLSDFTILDKDNMRLRITVAHRGNFQNLDLKGARTRSFYLYLKEALKECNIALSPPPPIVGRSA